MSSAGCGSRPKAAADGAVPETPTAKVRTALVRHSTVVDSVEGFGTTVAAPGTIRFYSIPFESRVRRLLVTEGSAIAAGTALIEVEPSRDTQLQLAQAHDEAVAAAEQKALVQERLGLKLSTVAELQQAEQRQRVASTREHDLEIRGAPGRQTLRADTDGVVARIDVQAGQVVAPGNTLLETVANRDVRIRLGVEVGDASGIRKGQPVRLDAVNGPAGNSAEGRVELIAGAVNPQTRLVDVFVSPGSAARLRLNQYVRGQIETGRHAALVVPREAVLPEEDHAIVFTVENGRAVRHVVRAGSDDGHVVEIAGSGIESGQTVVIQGNAELQDGMAVDPELEQ